MKFTQSAALFPSSYHWAGVSIRYCILGIIHRRKHSQILRILGWSRMNSYYHYLSKLSCALSIGTTIWLDCLNISNMKRVNTYYLIWLQDPLSETMMVPFTLIKEPDCQTRSSPEKLAEVWKSERAPYCMATPEEKQIDTHPKIECISQRIFWGLIWWWRTTR